MSFMWSRFGGTKCLNCHKPVKIGQMATYTPDGYIHVTCPGREDVVWAMDIMREWVSMGTVRTDDLAKAAKIILEHVEEDKK